MNNKHIIHKDITYDEDDNCLAIESSTFQYSCVLSETQKDKLKKLNVNSVIEILHNVHITRLVKFYKFTIHHEGYFYYFYVENEDIKELITYL